MLHRTTSLLLVVTAVAASALTADDTPVFPLMAWDYKDEPSADMYPALGRVAEEMRRLAPGKWPYINLLPGEGRDYDSYLEKFIQICQPPIVSYDRYVLFESGSQGPVFWTNLAQVRDAAQKYNLPFHNIFLTAAHWHYRMPANLPGPSISR